MFNIVATICFLQLTNLPPMCLANAYIPVDFETKDECLLKRNVLVQEIDEDLKARHVSMILYCIEKPKVQSTNV